jgi:exonuclease SbcC
MIHSIDIKNSIYFNEKLEVKTLSIGLDKYKGIVLITGDNGFGKSSLLEFMTPYRKLPSRPGAYKKHFLNECGSVSRIWTINGIKYEFYIKCNKNLTECYIYTISKDNIKTSILNSTSTEAYDTAVEEICGSSDIYFRTIFKNSENNIGTLKESNKKEYFIELIGASEYSKIKELSLKQKNLLKFDVDLLNNSKKKIVDYLSLSENQNLNYELKKLDSKFLDNHNKIDNLINEIKTINDNNLKIATESSKKAINDADIKNLKDMKTILENDLLLNEKSIIELQTVIDFNKNSIIEQNNSLKDFQDKIDKYKNPKDLLNKKIKISKDIKELENIYNTNLNKLAIINTKETLLNNSINELNNLISNLENTENELKIANKNKCEVDPLLCKNSFIIDTLINNIDILNNKINDFKATNIIEKTKEEIDALNKKLFYSSYKDNNELFDNINIFREELKTIPEDIEQIVADLKLSTYKLIQMKNKIIDLTNNTKEKEIKINDIVNNNKEKQITIDNLNNKINFLVEELLNLENIEHGSVNDKEEELKILNSNKDNLLIEITKLKSIYENIKEQKKELSVLNLKIDDLNKKINRHEFAEDFCNMKDGMPILKLKNKGKEIQDRANSILDLFRRTGIDYQVEFVTTKKDSTGKKDLDCFDIIITNEKEKQIDLNSLSSGQKIIIEMALSLSAAGENLADKFKTLLLDEADYALDAYNVESLYKTLQIIKDELEIEQIFVVTHNIGIQKTYPNQIKLEKGKEKY